MKGVILYMGRFGSTRQYAHWIKEATGFPVFNVKKEKPDLNKYDLLIVGSAIMISKPTIRKWLKKHWPEIKEKPALLFTVSGAAPDDPDLQKWLHNYIDREIIDKITYIPLRGRLNIKELPWLIRLMLKMGAKQEKDPEIKKRMEEGFDYLDQSSTLPIVEWAKSVQKESIKLA